MKSRPCSCQGFPERLAVASEKLHFVGGSLPAEPSHALGAGIVFCWGVSGSCGRRCSEDILPPRGLARCALSCLREDCNRWGPSSRERGKGYTRAHRRMRERRSQRPMCGKV
eukprot:5644832-Pyramimonas_sp.AAC.2